MSTKFILVILSIVCYSFSPLLATQSSVSITEEMQQNVDIIGHTFRINYAPAFWKAQQFNWQLEEAISKTKELILINPSQKNFQKNLKHFIQSMNDHHVGILFHSTEFAMLPFSLAESNRRFFISRAFSFLAQDIPLTLQRGDEILAIDDVPINVLFNEFLKAEYDHEPTPTETNIALNSFTKRMGMSLHLMPVNKDIAQIRIRNRATNAIETVPVKWNYKPELIPARRALPFFKHDHLASVLSKNNMSSSGTLQEQVIEQSIQSTMIDRIGNHWNNLVAHLKQDLSKNEPSEDEIKDLIAEFVREKEGTLLPPLGRTLWHSQPEDYFQAFIFQLPTKERIGFIRLRTFSPYDTANILWTVKKELGLAKAPWTEFAELMTKFQNETDALVLDQTDNHGGSFFYMIGLASMLTDRPLDLPKHHLTITSEDVARAVAFFEIMENSEEESSAVDQLKNIFQELLEDDTIHGYTMTPALLEQMHFYEKAILENWQQGNLFTEPYYLSGIDHVAPHPTSRYTKPLVILVNNMDFSCADFFPALMQDNKRAVIFGEKTAGAGGVINLTTFVNRMGIALYSFTTTLGVRADNKPIENLGVTPDVLYTPNAITDLKYGYTGYLNKLNQTLIQLIKKK